MSSLLGKVPCLWWLACDVYAWVVAFLVRNTLKEKLVPSVLQVLFGS